MSFVARHKTGLSIAALFLVPLVLLYAQSRAPSNRGPVTRSIVDVSGGLERALLATTGFLSDSFQKYVTAVAHHDELIELRRHERSADALTYRVAELERENLLFRQLAQAADRRDGPRPMSAQVIGRTGAPLTRIARIDRGRRDGVARGDGVVAEGGVVGRVLTAGYATSDVLLFSDPSSVIDSVVQRSRARGLVRGTGASDTYNGRVEDFDRLGDVEPGDYVITSGLEGAFPKGIPIGEITSVKPRADGLYLEAEIKPLQDLARVEWVSVLIHHAAAYAPVLGGREPLQPVVDRSVRPELPPGQDALLPRKSPEAKTDDKETGGAPTDVPLPPETLPPETLPPTAPPAETSGGIGGASTKGPS